MPDAFQVHVVTPEKQVLSEQTIYASIPAWDGLVGIESQRAPLLLKLGYGPLRLDLADGQSRTLFAGGGFAQMKDNVLTLLLDEALEPDDINVDEARAALDQAIAFQATTEEAHAKRERDQNKARGLLAVATR